MNKKGMTLSELIISVVLISVVLLFLYNLLASVTFEKNNDFIANLNQANRVDIVSVIEDDLLCDNIKSYEISGNSLKIEGTNTYNIRYYVDDKAYKFEYKINNEIVKTWTINGAFISGISCLESGDGKLTTKAYECSFMVNTYNKDNSKDNNNTLDDIILTFVNKVS